MSLENIKSLCPNIGEKILGVIVDITEYNKQINISLKTSDFEKYP